MVPDHWMLISQKYFFNLQPINYKLLSMNNMDEIMFHDMHDYKHAQRLWFQRFQMDKSQVGRFITVGQQIISRRWIRLIDQNGDQYKMDDWSQYWSIQEGWYWSEWWSIFTKAKGNRGLVFIQDRRRGDWMSALAWMIKYHSWLVTLTTWNWKWYRKISQEKNEEISSGKEYGYFPRKRWRKFTPGKDKGNLPRKRSRKFPQEKNKENMKEIYPRKR